MPAEVTIKSRDNRPNRLVRRHYLLNSGPIALGPVVADLSASASRAETSVRGWHVRVDYSDAPNMLDMGSRECIPRRTSEPGLWRKQDLDACPARIGRRNLFFRRKDGSWALG